MFRMEILLTLTLNLSWLHQMVMDFIGISMNNLKSNEKLFLGNDDSIAINGKLDFFTGTNTTKETADVLLSINNLELIQITIFR